MQGEAFLVMLRPGGSGPESFPRVSALSGVKKPLAILYRFGFPLGKQILGHEFRI